MFCPPMRAKQKYQLLDYIGCNDSMFAPLVEEHSHPIPFLRIIHQLELAKKESIGKGLLNHIKECLMINYITNILKVQRS